MDGVLVAYHNTARIFGFQYVSLEEMEERLYSSGNGTRVFNKCVLLLERILGDVISIYGERVSPSFTCQDDASSLAPLERQMHFRNARIEPGTQRLDSTC